MAYTHLTTDELAFIELYYHQKISVSEICRRIKRSRQTVYNVINALKAGISVLEFYQNDKKRKSLCGRRRIVLPKHQISYIQKRIADGWTPDTIIGRNEEPISCQDRYTFISCRIFKTSSLMITFSVSVNPEIPKCSINLITCDTIAPS